jgi:fibronectin-binding autotransporter adhesin
MRLRVLASAFLLASTLPVFSQTVWDGPASGAWTTATNWSNDDIPDTNLENVVIDNNAGQNSAVTLNLSTGTAYNVGTLTINTGDSLSVGGSAGDSGSSSLTLAGLANAGTLTYTVTSPGNIGTSTFNIGGTNQVFNTGTLNFRSTAGSNRVNAYLVVDANNTNAGALNISLNGSDRNTAELRLTNSGTFTNTGTITLLYNNTANSNTSRVSLRIMGGSVNLSATGAAAGQGVLILAQNTVNGTQQETQIIGNAAGSSLTNDAGHTIRGAGLIGGANLAFTNNGLVEATGATETLLLDPAGTSVNNGELKASGAAGLQLQSGTFTNNGVITVLEDSKLILGTSGILNNAAGSTLTLNGTLAGVGTVTTVNTDLTISTTGALAAGLSAGTLTMNLGTGSLVLNDLTDLNFELGTTSDLVSITGGLTLDGILNITALTGFDAGVYTLFNFTGALVNNGVQLGTRPDGYEYQIVTNANNVQLQVTAVPENSTGLLVVGTLGVLALYYRRSRKNDSL